VHEGECLGLAGPNGAGKSTVLGLAAGLYEPTVGSVTKRFDRVRDSGRQRVFYSFQNPERLFFAETVSEELNFGLERLGVASPEREERVRAALLEVGLTPESFLERVPVTLSPGEMRRVAFSIALSLEPEVLLLDEPTSCLDTAAISALSSILVSRRTGGQTTMLASHDASFLAGVCDRILWLRGGRIEAELATKDGCLPPGATWPGDLPPILELQERLADEGTDVTPRVLTADRLVERLL
jgi:energy-coupling factor transporter ATP-binding protein EcfA2